MSERCLYTLFGTAMLLVILTIGGIYFEEKHVVMKPFLLRSSWNNSSSDYKHNPKLNFVSFGRDVNNGRRLGNQIFALAAVIYIAEMTGREPVVGNSTKPIALHKIFMLNLKKVSNLCPCITVVEEKSLTYDQSTDKLISSDPKFVNGTILVQGYRHSWKYTLGIERRLRSQLVFKQEIMTFVGNFFQTNIPIGWKRVGFVRVGIHVRRTDILSKKFVNYGYTIPNETYFLKAMKYFTERYSRVQFIAASDDTGWTRKHLFVSRYSLDSVNITHSINHSPGQDLAILSMCDHVIMSTGTFGWWASWLAKGTTIYYGDWPRKGSRLYDKFVKDDFFPLTWIPMN